MSNITQDEKDILTAIKQNRDAIKSELEKSDPNYARIRMYADANVRLTHILITIAS